jgi:hypothetical protein
LALPLYFRSSVFLISTSPNTNILNVLTKNKWQKFKVMTMWGWPWTSIFMNQNITWYFRNMKNIMIIKLHLKIKNPDKLVYLFIFSCVTIVLI